MSKVKISVYDLNNLKKGEDYEFEAPITTRSIPKNKLSRGASLDRNEALRTISSGKYLGKGETSEHLFEGKKKGNGRHLYHFFIKSAPQN